MPPTTKLNSNGATAEATFKSASEERILLAYTENSPEVTKVSSYKCKKLEEESLVYTFLYVIEYGRLKHTGTLSYKLMKNTLWAYYVCPLVLFNCRIDLNQI